MITVQEVVVDPDMTAPEPFNILRSIGQYVLGGFQSTTTTIPQIGPVQQASDKEINMTKEADRVGSMRSFWCTVPVLVTRNFAFAAATHEETPQGAIPGTVYSLSATPAVIDLYKTGKRLQPNGVDYTLSGATITLTEPTLSSDWLLAEWPITANIQPAASDIIQYGQEQYRVLHVYRVPGSGYWKAVGTRLAAA